MMTNLFTIILKTKTSKKGNRSYVDPNLWSMNAVAQNDEDDGISAIML